MTHGEIMFHQHRCPNEKCSTCPVCRLRFAIEDLQNAFGWLKSGEGMGREELVKDVSEGVRRTIQQLKEEWNLEFAKWREGWVKAREITTKYPEHKPNHDEMQERRAS